MSRHFHIRMSYWKLYLIAASFSLLSACSGLQPQSPPPGQPPLPGMSGKNLPGPPPEVAIVRSILDGSGRPGASPLDLMRTPQVKQELNLTAAQSSQLEQLQTKLREQGRQDKGMDLGKLDSTQREQKLLELNQHQQQRVQATQAEVAKILQPEQVARFKGIMLQLYGWNYPISQQFVADLQLTSRQRQQLAAIHQQMLKQVSESWPTPNGDTPEAKKAMWDGYRQTMDGIVQQTNQQALAVLTPEQQKQLETLKGNKIDLDPTQLPGAPPPPDAKP